MAGYTDLPDEFIGLDFSACAATPGIIATLSAADSGLEGDINIFCKDGTPGNFTKRTINSTERICIGGSESYVAVCRYHFLQN